MNYRVKSPRSWMLFVCLCAWPFFSFADRIPNIQVVGLFEGKAMVSIDGANRFMAAGDTVDELLLVTANSREAVFEYRGQRYALKLSQRISAGYSAPEKITASIVRNNKNQYLTPGSINGQPVTFIIDTGANTVALNRNVARQLGIDFRSSKNRGIATTASGTVPVYQVVLDQVKVGEILVKNVEAGVIDADYPQHILLGMTFLGKLDLRERDGILYLDQTF